MLKMGLGDRISQETCETFGVISASIENINVTVKDITEAGKLLKGITRRKSFRVR